MVYAQPRIRLGEWDAQTSLGFWDTNGSPNLGQMTRPSDNQQLQKKKKKKKKKREPAELLTSPSGLTKIKQREKRYRKLDFARELKMLWSIKVTMISIVIGTLETIPKSLVKGLEDLEIRGKEETIETTVLLRSARIPWRVLETWGDLLSHKLLWKTISKHWWENSPGEI